VVALAGKTKTPLFRIEDGKSVTSKTPGITEALTKVGMNNNQQQNLARALFAIEAGRRGGSNQNRKEMFDAGIPMETNRPVEGGGNHESLGGGAVPIARLGREKIEGREVKSELQKLVGVRGNPGAPLTDKELRDARSPFQGGTQERGIPRAQFVSAKARQMSPAQREAEYGPVNAEIANRVERRYQEAEARKAAQPEEDSRLSLLRQKDAQFAEDAAVRREADSRRALLQAAEDMGKPRNKGQMLLGGQIVPMPKADQDRYPYNEQFNLVPEQIAERPAIIPMASGQKATSAVANANTQSVPLEARGGWMGGDNSGAEVNAWTGQSNAPREIMPDPWDQAPATGSGIDREIARRVDVKSQKALPYGIGDNPVGVQGPEEGNLGRRIAGLAKVTGRRTYSAGKKFATSPQHRRGRRIGYGVGGGLAGIAGLDALIGGERNRREEEGIQ
jgi:hypothetical protein